MYFKEYTENIFTRRPRLKEIDRVYYGEKDKRIYYCFNKRDSLSIIDLIQNFYRELERLVLFNEYKHLKTRGSDIRMNEQKLDCPRLIHRKYIFWLDIYYKKNANCKYIATRIYPFEFKIIYPKKTPRKLNTIKKYINSRKNKKSK